MNLLDEQARNQAISPDDSYIVQAPAGSGKTELLTQRFLNLLARVDAPEQVVALTFTRKAASEMKERILSTLSAAQGDRTQAVLARDEQLNWQILKQPHRLRVMTIDALCQWILSVMPYQSEFVANADMDMYPLRLYGEAAKACLLEGLEDLQIQPLILTLLNHLDNQQDRLIQLMVNLLSARDQWLGVVYSAKMQSRAQMEAALKQIEHHALAQLLESLPTRLQPSLVDFCARLVRLENVTPLRQCLRSWTRFELMSIEQAKALASILLTSQQTLRKRADHHVGLKKDHCTPDVFAQLKADSEALFEQLSVCEQFIERLIHVSVLPDPHYNSGQWDVLQALLTLLPRLVAHLKMVCAEKNRVDFIEVSESALRVLGEDLDPTDLSLYLDHAIQHVLIDEFQDTSLTQFQLIRRLISGWEAHDGRTLFIVGDPMQSIYRFRQAEVGLFLKVQQTGIGSLRLKPLSLSANFRSSPSLVEWVNQHVSLIFPQKEDIESGAVSFHAAQPCRQDLEETRVRAIQTSSAAEEATYLVRCIQENRQAYPQETMAILVRSRAQLEWIIPALQNEHIPFEGVDLFPLSDLSLLRDVYSLTQALLLPEERLPWLCVLRSPYVGLTLKDLHGIAVSLPKGSIYENLSALSQSAALSEDGRKRLSYVQDIFSQAYLVQDQFSLSTWILNVHIQLHGQAQVDEAAWQNLERYFELIDQFSEQNTLSDWTLFNDYFSRIFSTQASPSLLKIMTIHQSKGLEFDAVFLPGLGGARQPSKPSLLRWMSVLQAQGEKLWLLSPLKSQEEEGDPLYDFLGRLDQEKERYEKMRLFYVAVTRAKKRLVLLDGREKPQAGSFRSLLRDQSFECLESGREEEHQVSRVSGVFRLTLEEYLKGVPGLFAQGGERPRLVQDNLSRRIGVIAHRWLQRIPQAGWTQHDELPWDRIARDSEQSGLLGQEKIEAVAVLSEQFHQLFNSEIGQWLMRPHGDAQNEYAFCVTEQGKTRTYVVDRLFYAEGRRWIIDYKTGRDDMDSELEHRQQVEQYAKYLREYYRESISCGLYYLATTRWVSWVFEEDVCTV